MDKDNLAYVHERMACQNKKKTTINSQCVGKLQVNRAPVLGIYAS